MRQEIEDYLVYLEKVRRLKRISLEAYKADINQFFNWVKNNLSGYIKWRELTRRDVDNFKGYLGEFNYSTATVARKLVVVRSFIGYLSDMELVEPFLFDKLPKNHVPVSSPRSITESEIGKLLEGLQADKRFFAKRNLAIYYLIWKNGLNISEVVSLNLEDLDLENRVIRINSDRDRTLVIDDETTTTLLAYLSEERNSLRRRSSNFVFLNRRGEQLTRQGFWLILKLCARDKGLPEAGISSRTLRNAFITSKLRGGVSPEKVRELLGFRHIHNVMYYTR